MDIELDLSEDDVLDAWIGNESKIPVFSPVYRMPERDNQTGPKAIHTQGDWIEFSRIVVRIGYEIGVHSVSKKEWNQAGLEIIADRTKLPIEDVRRVVIELGLGAPFKEIKGSIYDRIVRPLINTSTIPNVRAMWFHDLSASNTLPVERVVTRRTGIREPGCRGGYYGEEYEPPILTASHNQYLYLVTFNGQKVMVHPLDVEKK